MGKCQVNQRETTDEDEDEDCSGNVLVQVGTQFLIMRVVKIISLVLQTVFAIVASMDYIAYGMSMIGGLSSSLIYSLEHGTEGISTSLEDASWIRKNRKLVASYYQQILISFLATLYVLGEILGSFVSGWVSSAIGRVRTMVLFGIPFIITNLVIAFSKHSLTIYAGCFIQGVCAIVGTITRSL